MNTKFKWIVALFGAFVLPALALSAGLAFDQALPTVTDLGVSALALAPMIVIGAKKYTLTQAVDQRGILLSERNSILDGPAETRGEGDAAEQVLSADQTARITAIDSELRSLDVRIEEARERIRLDQEQRDLQAQARSTDVFYAPDPARRGPSSGERRDVAQFSLGRALRLASEGRNLDGVEAEMVAEGESEARASGISVQAGSIMVGSLALSSGEVRDQTATGTANLGGNLIQSDVGSLLDALMERLVFSRLGCDMNMGLVGNFSVNRIVRGTAPSDKAENAAATEVGVTFEPAALTPRRVPTYVDISKQLFAQSGERNLQRRVQNHILSETRIAMEKSYITDILATSGIGDVAGGTNGLAPTYTQIVNIAAALTAANVDPDAIKYLLNTAVESYLMRAPLTVDSSGEPVGDGKILPSGSDRLAGRGFELSNVVPSNLTKGNSTGVCSAIIAGDFSGYTIGQWGGIEFLVDNLTQATTGMNRIHCAVYHDGVVNDPGKFAAMQDALTA
jgi:HK97 family phage major capsid protein